MIRIGMLTSGGDCQALNAAMRGVVKTLVNSGEQIEIFYDPEKPERYACYAFGPAVKPIGR